MAATSGAGEKLNQKQEEIRIKVAKVWIARPVIMPE